MRSRRDRTVLAWCGIGLAYLITVLSVLVVLERTGVALPVAEAAGTAIHLAAWIGGLPLAFDETPTAAVASSPFSWNAPACKDRPRSPCVGWPTAERHPGGRGETQSSARNAKIASLLPGRGSWPWSG